ncbi:MAG: HEPN domain-containing protein [Candidatus Tectomicrobia bacterium]|nr:HEPN domain-containing protein [Candidatus Tectomicrobia bacterium]
MIEKARQYIEPAEALQLRKDYDSAMSRLYYAMFYCAEALLLMQGYSFSSHRAVSSAFAQYFVKPGLLPREFHQWFRAAFAKRQISDYEFVGTVDEEDVVDMKMKAEQFLSKTEEFLRSEGHS